MICFLLLIKNHLVQMQEISQNCLYLHHQIRKKMLKITVEGKSPVWGQRCMIADNATLAGDITMGDDCSIWFSAVLRADVNKIVIGDRCNVQDLACIHQSTDAAAVLGNDVSLGHGAIVHAATIHDGALIGMNAVVLDHAEVGRGSIVAAGAVVVGGTKIPDGEIWGGIPAHFIKKTAPGQAESYAENYLTIKEWYED